MNRETKRMMQRQGQVGPDGAPAVDKRRQQTARRATAPRERTSPLEFFGEVRAELRRVAWPSRSEVANYSAIVLFTLVLLIGLIFVLDYLFARAILFLFET